MPPPLQRDYIDLTFDSEGEVADPGDQHEDNVPPLDDAALLDEFLDFGDPAVDNLVDLARVGNIPDIDVASNIPPPRRPIQDDDDDENAPLDNAVCLQMVLDVLPDVAVSHVLDLINEQAENDTLTAIVCGRLIASILDGGPYPKEEDEVNKRKRKREQEDEDGDQQELETYDHYHLPDYRHNALNLLKDEFLDLPIRHIDNTFNEKRTLYDTYVALETQLRQYNLVASTFRKIGKPRPFHQFEKSLAAQENRIVNELKAARKKCQTEAAKRRTIEMAKRAEDENFARAKARGDMSECQCCFEEIPMNRMTCCDGNIIHFFCRDCTKNYVENVIGNMKCRLICFADADCGGTFTRQHLLESLSKPSFDRLEHLRQQADLAAAGLDFLDECPFCDYKEECLPVEEDKEFRCKALSCSKTSCRLCQRETHIPMSCEEAHQDEKLNVRHTVEEAKSEALIRKCNNCKNPFVKESGCNKMACSRCGNTQCYVCSQNVRNYDHFGNKRCPLHDNQEDRHEKEIQQAEEEALRKIRADRPDISEDELKIQVSDRVKQEEEARKQRAQARHQGFGFYMDGNELRAIRPGQRIPLGFLAAQRQAIHMPQQVPQRMLPNDQENHLGLLRFPPDNVQVPGHAQAMPPDYALVQDAVPQMNAQYRPNIANLQPAGLQPVPGAHLNHGLAIGFQQAIYVQGGLDQEQARRQAMQQYHQAARLQHLAQQQAVMQMEQQRRAAQQQAQQAHPMQINFHNFLPQQ